MKQIHSLARVNTIVVLGSLFLFGCNDKNTFPHKAGSATSGNASSATPSDTPTLPTALRAGLILRYNRPGIRDQVMGYVSQVNNQPGGTFTVQYLIREPNVIFYETRVIPVENLKVGHRLDHTYVQNGGRVARGGSGLTLLASAEMLKQLNSQGDTTFGATGDRATGLHKTGNEPYEFLYNGQKVKITGLQAQTSPLNSSFYRSFPIWFWDQPTLPVLLRYEQTFLGSIDDVAVVAGTLRKALESKQVLLTGSLYTLLYSLMGGEIHREVSHVAEDLWAQGIIPVLQNQPHKKMIVELFTVSNRVASLAKSDRFGLPYALKAIHQFLLRGGVPADRFVVQAGSRVDNLPEEISPIGQDPNIRILIRIE